MVDLEAQQRLRKHRNCSGIPKQTGVGGMKNRKTSQKAAALAIVLCLSAMLLTACGGVSEEMLEARTSAIAKMDNGDYEGAVEIFNQLVEEAKSVSEFELDVLKYRAEAEYLLGDYEAAIHTWQILTEVDQERPEYQYCTSMAMAENYQKNGMTEEAKEVYQSLIDVGQGNTRIYNRLMLLAMEEEDYDEALKMAAKGKILTDGLAVQELEYNTAVCYEYQGEFAKALELFRAYEASYGTDERVSHEIAFLETR